MAKHRVWVGCANCGEHEHRLLPDETIQANAPGELLAVACSSCAIVALVMTRPPWVLSEADWVILKLQRIRPD